jgi:Mg2+ and Co2+ transporter CorA
MLTAYPASGHAEASPAARDVSWLDLLNPTNEEEASVESRYGLKLPSRQELSEVESSSRVSEKNGVLFLNMPTVSQMSGLDEAPSPVGFVLSKDLLVTIRYTHLRSFETVAEKFSKDVGPATRRPAEPQGESGVLAESPWRLNTTKALLMALVLEHPARDPSLVPD